jgi:hypothetical protein
MPAHNPLHETIHHPFLPRPVELDRQLVAVDGGEVPNFWWNTRSLYRSNSRDIISSNE